MKNEKNMNLLIPYVHLPDHQDPILDEFTYGDLDQRARKLKRDCKRGDYVFLHTSRGGDKYITAYYVVDRVLDTAQVVKDRNIVAKYKNPHIREFFLYPEEAERDDVILFGDPVASRVLERPLLFNKALAKKLSLNIEFPKDRTETQAIGSATRNWRELTGKDVRVLLDAIKSSEKEGFGMEAVLSTDEVTEVIEKDIERFIMKHPRLIGESLRLIGRQLQTPVGIIDLLYEDKEHNPVVVELKLDRIGRDAVNQVRRYVYWLEKETKREATGVIACKGVMPAFEEDLKKLKDIKILCYGWQLRVYPWRET